MQVLVIDDNSTSIFLTEMLLRREGFADTIRSFMVAEDAVNYLSQTLPTQVPKVVFLDLNMPVMDGWEFLEALQPHAEALAAQCRIYILTSSLAPSDVARAQEHPLVTELLRKPITGPTLQAIRAQISELNNQ